MANRTVTAHKTVGLSPKATSASAAALVAPLLARLVAKLLGIEIENEVAEGLILGGIAAASALLAAWKARPGRVVVQAPSKD